MISINHFHSMAIGSLSASSATGATAANGGRDVYGFLPPQLLRQIEEQTGYLQSKIAEMTSTATNSTTTTTTSSHLKRSVSTTHDNNQQPGPHRKWAYAFLMAGVNAKSLGYRGILYNVLVSAEFLKDSQADVVIMVQMA